MGLPSLMVTHSIDVNDMTNAAIRYLRYILQYCLWCFRNNIPLHLLLDIEKSR